MKKMKSLPIIKSASEKIKKQIQIKYLILQHESFIWLYLMNLFTKINL